MIDENGNEVQKCPACKQTRMLFEFSRRTEPDKYGNTHWPTCKQCNSLRQKIYKQKHGLTGLPKLVKNQEQQKNRDLYYLLAYQGCFYNYKGIHMGDGIYLTEDGRMIDRHEDNPILRMTPQQKARCEWFRKNNPNE